MLNVPIYDKYNDEKKIALIDNSAVAFMQQLSNKGHKPELLLQGYDVIFLPGWVVEELQDSTFRVRYIENLVREGFPIRVINETTYSELMDGEEINLYQIVKASVSSLGTFLKYMRLNVEKKDLLDMDLYEEWIQEMYTHWPMQEELTDSGRVKKKNAGEISLTILSEIFSWHYPETEVVTVYTQDTDSYVFQKQAEEKLKKIFKQKIPVSVSYRSNDAIMCQLYRNKKLSTEDICSLRKDARNVTYMLERADKTVVLETRQLNNEEFIELLQDETMQIIF